MLHQCRKMGALVAQPPEQLHGLVDHLFADIGFRARHFRPIVLILFDPAIRPGYSPVVLKQDARPVQPASARSGHERRGPAGHGREQRPRPLPRALLCLCLPLRRHAGLCRLHGPLRTPRPVGLRNRPAPRLLVGLRHRARNAVRGAVRPVRSAPAAGAGAPGQGPHLRLLGSGGGELLALWPRLSLLEPRPGPAVGLA